MGGASSSPVPGGGTSGYHVLRVQEGSPGHKAGLQAFFDFIVSINDTRLEEDNDTIKQLLQNNKDKPVRLTVYSSKTQQCREVVLTPNTNWGGQGLMGVSIRYCSFEGANENVWHVLDVESNSPAALAGLIPHADYIIGSDSVLNERDDFYNLIEAADGQQVKLYVYNSDWDTCREVRLCPNSNWGGSGLLGCDIGYGYLHRIPVTRSFPATLPPDDIVSKPTPSKDLPVGGLHTVPLDTNQIPAYPPPSYAPASVHPSTNTPTFSEVPLTAPTTSPIQSHMDTYGQMQAEHAPLLSASHFRPHLPPPAPLPVGLTHLSSTTGAPVHPAPQHPVSATYSQSVQLPIPPPPASSAPLAPSVPVQQSSYPFTAHPRRLFQTVDPSVSVNTEIAPADHTTTATGNSCPYSAVSTAVLSPPGMPPLDVSMPPLSELHVVSNASS
ncbi:Golgi reassembly-stacking protein 2 [Fasciola hepatica]|uniref:Golgi reassembly-stacking protein 2 n=1 Tax=Fasciola hepatica TaxID=6192 RepID=A0A4E0R4G5_FASHE|nr:Golgi reassembly-stacking protein 2 [Fasciola hepatica]